MNVEDPSVTPSTPICLRMTDDAHRDLGWITNADQVEAVSECAPPSRPIHTGRFDEVEHVPRRLWLAMSTCVTGSVVTN